ncbi:MAG TPA: SMI1/KNR4 family protein [Niastella sp.]
MKNWIWNFRINKNDQLNIIVNIPHPIRQFIETGIVTGSMALPFHYPLLHEPEGWQSGFRYHGLTMEDITSTKPGGWQPGWYVIALNGFDDPYFVDFTEANLNFPVYYAKHGAGRWKAIKAAENISQFSILLMNLQDYSADKEASLHFLQLHTDLTNELWREVFESISNPDEPLTEKTESVDPALWVMGKVIITTIGPNKMKVVHYLKERFHLSPQEALAMSKQERIEVAEGFLLHLQRTIDQLSKLGATARFIQDEK